MPGTPLLQPTDRTNASAMQNEWFRVRAEIVELIAGAKRTIAQSQTLLVEADTILAKEKLPLLKSNRR